MLLHVDLLMYFAVGIVLDVLLTLNWRFVNQEKAVLAGLFSFVVTLASMTVFYGIMQNLDPKTGLPRIVAYALGVAVGTFVGIKLPITKKLKK